MQLTLKTLLKLPLLQACVTEITFAPSTPYLLIPNDLSACKRLFLLLLQHRKIAESEKASINFRLNKSQKNFLVLLQHRKIFAAFAAS